MMLLRALSLLILYGCSSFSFAGSNAVRLEDCPSSELKLVAVPSSTNGKGFFACGLRVFEAQAPANFLDGRIVSINAEGASLQVNQKSTGKQKVLQQKLFGIGKIDPIPVTAEHEGSPINIAFNGDIRTFATLLARAFGLNVILESETAGTVKVMARDTAWDAVVAQALKSGGFDYKVESNALMRIAPAERIPKLKPLSTIKGTAEPVSFQFTNADLIDVVGFLQQLLNKKIELPPGPYEPITMFINEWPADDILDVLIVSRGWTHHSEGETIVVSK